MTISIPNDRTPLPDEVSGYPVIDHVRLRPLPGELSEVAVVIGRDPLRPEAYGYAVWDAAVRNEKWTLFNGA